MHHALFRPFSFAASSCLSPEARAALLPRAWVSSSVACARGILKLELVHMLVHCGQPSWLMMQFTFRLVLLL